MDDEFDILQLRKHLQDTTTPDRRRSASGLPRPGGRRASDKAKPELRGASLFEWAGIEELAARVEHDEAAPLVEPRMGPLEGSSAGADDWPPLSVVPTSPENHARPFGRRTEPAGWTDAQGVMHLVDVAGAPFAQAASMSGSASGVMQEGSSNLARRFIEEAPEVPPDPYVAAEAEFVDVISPLELEAAERAAEELRQAINLLSEASAEKARPAEALLNSLVNKLLLERDRLGACMSDHQAPLVLSPLRRRRGERDHVDLSTANDRG